MALLSKKTGRKATLATGATAVNTLEISMLCKACVKMAPAAGGVLE